jgi:hypothetical protein
MTKVTRTRGERPPIEKFYHAIRKRRLQTDKWLLNMSAEIGIQTTPRGRSAHMAKRMSTDQISFYDESLKKQIEGSYVTDGKEIHVRSVSYGIKSAHYRQVGAAVDQDALDLLAQKLLSELARDAAKDTKSH